jgi:phospholipase C
MPKLFEMPVTRRRVLQGAGLSLAAVAASPLLPGSAFAAPTQATTQQTLTQQQTLAQQNIKHIVFLMMENRSFDHLCRACAASTTAA